jgi:NTE family protein
MSARASPFGDAPRARSFLMFLVLLGACGNAGANQAPAQAAIGGHSCGARAPGDTRPRIGLALGGGGARGIAHISVLRALEDLHVPVDCIAGTSAGALVGGLYASGMPVGDLERLVVETDWKDLFDDSLERRERSFRRKQDDRDGLATVGVGIKDGAVKAAPGLLQGERVLALFERSTLRASTIDDFDRLPIPFRAVATDLNSGQAVVLGHGSLALAMRASMSLPGIFKPVEVDGRVLLDGGLVNQVPIDVVRAMGAEVVIAVDVGTPLATLGGDASLLEVVAQISGMMTTGNTQRQLQTLATRDVLITPELGDAVATGDFDKAREALAIGAAAAAGARTRLAVLAVPAGTYARWRERGPTLPAQDPVIEFVRLDNQTPYADEVLLAFVPVPTGVPLDTARMEQSLLRAYSLATLSSVTYEVVEEGGRTGVIVRARPKPQGPHYLQLGLSVHSDFESAFEGNLRLAVLSAPLTRYGAESRVTATIGSEPGLKAEYYHPLDPAMKNQLFGSLEYANPNIHVFDADGNNIATYDVRIGELVLRAGRDLGDHGAVSVGLLRATGSARVETGDPGLEDFDFEQGNLFANLTIDRLDSLYFPRTGYYASLGFSAARDWLGSDSEFEQLDLDLLAARSFGRHSVQGRAAYHATVSGIAPIQSLYRLGGRGRLAGFRLNELTGQHYALLVAGYSYQLAEFLGRSAQVGGTIEYGNAWERRQDMGFDDGLLNASVYLGFDSWLGPMLFGVGWRETGHRHLFLEIGRAF